MSVKFLNTDWNSMLKSSSLVLVLKILGAVGGYSFVWVVINIFGPGTYGLFEVAFTFLSILAALSKWGTDGLAVREIPNMNEQDGWNFVRKVQSFVGLSSLAFGLILFLSADILEDFFNDFGLGLVLRMTALTLPFFSLFQIHSEYLRARKQWLLYGVFQTSFFLGLISLLMYLFPDHFFLSREAFLLIFPREILPMGFLFIISFFAFTSIRFYGPLFHKSWRSLKNHASSATSMFLTGALFMIMSWSDTLTVSYFMSAEDVANYRVAFKIATLITFTQFAINARIAPQISSLWINKKAKELQSIIHKASLINTIVGIPLFLGIMFFGQFLLSIFGEGFEGSLSVLRILCFGQIINALCGPVMYLLNMTGNEKKARNTMIYAAIINISANILLIPLFGLKGAAWATSSTMIIWNIWALLIGYKQTGIRTLIFWR
jgi:O-antigen/teichoic acid export membrane protein